MKDKQKNFAYLAKKILKGVLIVDANTNSSVMSYQPSTPIELKNLRYKKNNE